MIAAISNKIANVLYENDEKKSVGIDTYRYGLDLLISTIVNVSVIIRDRQYSK